MEVECVPKEGKREVLTLYVNGEPWRDIHRTIFGKDPRIPLKGTSDSDLADQFHEQEYSQTKKYVIKRLATINYSSFELKKILEDRLVSESTINKIIEEFKRLGYLNDFDWIESFIRRQLIRNDGPQKIAMKLRAKGVPKELIQEFLLKLDDSHSQLQRISRLIQVRFRSRDLSDYREKQKVVAALARKGFDLAVIHEALNEGPGLPS